MNHKSALSICWLAAVCAPVAAATAGQKAEQKVPPIPQAKLQALVSGPMRGAREIVFAVRQPGKDGHWYANFGYRCENEASYVHGAMGRLCKVNLLTGELTTLLEDLDGAVRDPQVHYDGKRILFSYRKGREKNYHLDGKGGVFLLFDLPKHLAEKGAATPSAGAHPVMALRSPPARIEKFEGLPEVFDSPRDIQPILDRHCIRCHDSQKRAGKVVLEGDRSETFSISYAALTLTGQISDARNREGNRPPYSIGTAASPLLRSRCISAHVAYNLTRPEKSAMLLYETDRKYWSSFTPSRRGTARATRRSGGSPLLVARRLSQNRLTPPAVRAT